MSIIFNVLGTGLTELIDQSELLCRGVIRYAISDNFVPLQHTNEVKVWRQHLQGMSFQDWEILLQSHAFAVRLSNVGVKNPDEVAQQLHHTLVEKQSLFTMSTTPGRSR